MKKATHKEGMLLFFLGGFSSKSFYFTAAQRLVLGYCRSLRGQSAFGLWQLQIWNAKELFRFFWTILEFLTVFQ